MRRRLSDEEIAAQRRKRRRVQIGCGVGALVVVGFIGWLGYEGLQAKSNLEKAQDFATQAKDALLAGDTDRARVVAGDADRYAQDAQGSVDSVPWRVAGAVPFLGSPFDSTRQMTTIVSGLTEQVLLPAVDAGSAVSPDQLILDGARINLAALRDAAPVLETTSAAISDLDEQAQNVDSTWLGLLDDARVDLQEQVSELSGLLNNTSLAAQIAPAMLGADGPRSYFIGFQTNAEARGTGGLLGGFGIVRASDGDIRIDDLGQNREFDFLGRSYEPLDLGPDFSAQYGESGATTRAVNSNVSSHFPYAAQIWQSLWQQESGERVDGAIATDPVALSYVLRALGPIVMPDGEYIDAGNVVELTESTAYMRFANDNDARKQYLQTVAAKVVEKMTSGISNPTELLNAIGRAASERRIALWSADPAVQNELEKTPLGHVIPTDDAPYAGIVVNNLGGNKLDYYLRREINYTASHCDEEYRDSTITVRLTNAIPQEDFTEYVAGMFDNPVKAPKGTNLTDLALVATKNAKLRTVTIDGKPGFAFIGNELGHPVFRIQTPIAPGETVEVAFDLEEPTSSGAPRVPIQPLIDTPRVNIDVPVCD
ncbi:hypothetical protein B9C99_11900 [Rhodococcus sp. BUPNP1]|nr:hypothetical protein B9C99_11900 [Rhodococcus sp. BUPNP1]